MKLGNLLVMGLTTLVLSPSSWALVGGPWDHLIKGNYSRANTDGLYEASISMKNGSGFLRFTSNTSRATLADPVTSTVGLAIQGNNVSATATNSTAGLAARSNTVLFYKGNAYYGSVYGTVSSASKTVSGGGGGQSSVVDSIEASVQQLAQNINAFVNINGFSESMNITFKGKVTTQIPEIRFEAKGEAIFFSRPNINVSLIPLVGVPVNQAVEELYEIKLAPGYAGGPIKPDATENIRLFGGRVNLQTNFATATTTTTGAATGN